MIRLVGKAVPHDKVGNCPVCASAGVQLFSGANHSGMGLVAMDQTRTSHMVDFINPVLHRVPIRVGIGSFRVIYDLLGIQWWIRARSWLSRLFA
jgi:hypothetical protein